MTEVPEHLLRRSQERRAALGLGGDAPAGSDAPAAATPATTGGAEPAGSAAAAVPAAAPSAPAVIEAEPEVPSEVYFKLEAVKRNRVPMWAMPVLVALPFYGFLYAGAFGERGHGEEITGVELGRQVFAGNCASCHGSSGQGGVGPQLAGDEVEKTFLDEADHIAFVKSGSSAIKGQPYGNPEREGGQRIAETGGMPSFGGTLSDAEIEAVVLYEREELN